MSSSAIPRGIRPVLGRFYPAYLLSQLPRVLRRIRADARCRRTNGLVPPAPVVAAARQSDTLFVLGSGTSINRMSERLWHEIAASDSIGFNNWMLHDFVPTFYMRESKSEYGANAEFVRLMQARREEYARVPMILRGFKDGQRRDMLQPGEFPEELRARLSMPLHMDVPARTESELRVFLRLWRRLGLLRWRDVHLTCRASLSTLIYIGVIHGYRHIVLCGIDLNDSRYFWQDGTDAPPEYDLVPIAAEGERHKTLDPDLGLPIDLVVQVFREELLEPLGISLHVASGTSALAAFLPVYEPDAA